MSQKILVIEDDKNIQKLLEINLSAEGYEVFQAQDGLKGLVSAGRLAPDLIILDINLPELNGKEVCRRLKADEKTKAIPVVILTVKKEEIDRVLGFEIGADDYVTKPFSPRELMLRVKSVLRRGLEPVIPRKIGVGDVVLDENNFEVTVSGKPVSLTAKEFNLLKHFLARKERIVSRESLLNNVWGYTSEVDTRTVDAHIKSLRKKLPSKKVKIVTIIGMGYKLTEKC